MPAKPTVSVVVVNYRRAQDTVTCLRGLRDELAHPVHEIICVDNASGDGSAERIAAQAPPPAVRLVRAERNLGFAGGCNLGVAHATGAIIGLLNSDARPHPDWVDAAVEVFAEHPDVAAVASKVLDWDGERIDYAGAAVSWFGMGFKPGYGEPAGAFDTPADVLFATGAAMFVRADRFRELGGFDERFFMFYEDVDLGWRLNLRGYRVRYQPASVAYHRHHASMVDTGEFREHFLLERNALLTLHKNLEQATLDRVLPAALALAVRRATARGRLDPDQFDLAAAAADDAGTGTGTASPAAGENLSVSKVAMAGVLAVDRFVELLPSSQAAREVEQAARVRTDAALRPLLGDTGNPLLELAPYLHAHRVLSEAFGIEDALGRRRRVVVLTADAVSQRMAGPAIRAWNIAKVLSAEHDVRLVSTNVGDSVANADAPFPVAVARPRELPGHVDWADIVILQGWALESVPSLKDDRTTLLVCDLYDPMHFEVLAQQRDLDGPGRDRAVEATVHALSEQLRRGDFFLCATQRQRHLWLGHLSALGRLTPRLYDADPTAQSLLAVAPFGLPDHPPRRSGPGPRALLDGIGEADKLVLWGGGVYSWFDPLTLVRAVHRLAGRHGDIRLVFQGMRHPNSEIAESAVAHDVRALAARLGLTGKHVFFNETWVPYDQRHNWLLDADCAVSTHFEHVETTFAFRTRMLDYLWAGLPVVTSDGDAFADLVRDEGLGLVVPAQDPSALADALARVLYDEEFAARCRRQVAAVRGRFTWPTVLEPLVRYCRDPRPAADRVRRPGPLGGGVRPHPPAAPSTPVGARLRADLGLARRYLRDGGVTEVARRAGGRIRRLARDLAR